MPDLSAPPPEALNFPDFGGWLTNVTNAVDAVDKVLDQATSNPLLRMILGRTGALPALDNAHALLDVLEKALHQKPA